MGRNRSNATAPAVKGNLVAGTGADTSGLLTVGADGTVLTADSAEATGLKWGTAASGFDPVLTPEISAVYIRNNWTTLTSAINPVLNRTYYIPVFLPTFTADRIGFDTNGFTTAGVSRLGLYAANSATGLPDTVVFDAGTVNVTASLTQYTITISQSITGGWYYFAYNMQGGTYEVKASDAKSSDFANIASNLTATPARMFTEDSISGAFTTAGTLQRSTSSVPSLGLRVA